MNNNYLFNYKPPTRLRPLPTGTISDYGKWDNQMNRVEPFPLSDSHTYVKPIYHGTDDIYILDSFDLTSPSFTIIENFTESDSGNLPGESFTNIDTMTFLDSAQSFLQGLVNSDSIELSDSVQLIFTFSYQENIFISDGFSLVVNDMQNSEPSFVTDSVTFTTPEKKVIENFWMQDDSSYSPPTFTNIDSIVEGDNIAVATYKNIEGFWCSDNPSYTQPVYSHGDNFTISDSIILSKYDNTDMMPITDSGTLIKP